MAAHAGVSPTVVSRVLHNRATAIRVSPKTADRVRESAHQLGYRLNIAARNFRDGQTKMLGVLHGIGFGRPYFNRGSRYFAALMDGIVEGAFQNGYSVTLCPKLLGSSPEDGMSDGRFDGLIWYSTSPTEETMNLLRRCRTPLVLIHNPAELLDGRFPSVMCDNAQGIRLAVEHLVGLGHKKIGFVQGSHDGFNESNIRRDAFLALLEEFGVERNENTVVNLGWRFDAIGEYFAAGPKHTALIADSDDLAGDFLRAAQARGLTVPDDISIIGFDSTEFCEQFHPALTSIRQPLSDIGSKAIDLLVNHIVDREAPNSQFVIPCDLDVRGSTAPVPQS